MLPEDVAGTRRIALPRDILSPGSELTLARLFEPIDELAARRRPAVARDTDRTSSEREAVNYKLGGLR